MLSLHTRCIHVLCCWLLCTSIAVKGGCLNSFEEKSALFGGLIPYHVAVANNYTLPTPYCFTTKQQFHQPGHEAEKSTIISDFCFPTVLVAGFPKCATSFLFHALSKHPHILPTRRKELCLGGPLSETWPKLISYLPSAEDAVASGGQIVMTGCLHLGANIRAIKELCVPTNEVKVIFLVRDVADMLWAAYNYWCNVETDGPKCSPGKHTEPGHDQRSPSLFHSRVELGLPMGGGYPLSARGVCFKRDLQQAAKVFGTQNVLVLKSEDILDEREKPKVLKSLLTFLQLDGDEQRAASQQWLNDQISTQYMINSGTEKASKGVHTKIVLSNSSSSALKKGLYEASGYVPMLPETRQLIYQRWRKECRFLRIRYGIEYANC